MSKRNRRMGCYARGFVTLVIVCLSVQLFAGMATAIYRFPKPEMDLRFSHILKEYRCLVCQNESLADSDAALAQDLRAIIHQKLLERQSDAQINTFLVSRYGDFIKLKPPMNGHTWLLWLMPWLAVVMLAIFCCKKWFEKYKTSV